MFRHTLAAAVLLSALPVTGALAASIHATDFTQAAYNAATSGGTFVGLDFEAEGDAAGEGEVGPALVTHVGTFTTMGGTGSGGTVSGLPGNTGTELALRDGNTYGRVDTVGGRWYLDSNDTYGILWNADLGGALFKSLTFVLTDGSDVGAYLRVSAAGSDYELRSGGRLPNGYSSLVTITFEDYVQSALVELVNYTTSGGTALRRNDGFSIDGVQVELAPVPLPAAGLMLVAGLGGLAALRRRKHLA
ncbi:MAG: VPLPA-CTERM sorting domain-containing protein [Pseudomonadota bacterium]